MTHFSKSFAVAIAAAISLVAPAANAVEAVSTVELNVRTGPGSGFGILDTLDPGELVNTTECTESGWCYIQQDGPDGWVYSSYLTVPSTGGGGGGSGSDCELRLTLGPGGPKLEVVCSTPTPPPPTPTPTPTPTPPPVGDEVCFYRDAGYSGPSFCYAATGTLNSLNAAWNDRISSVRVFGSAKARMCVDTNLGGYCRDVTVDTPALGPFLNDKVSSLRVYTGFGGVIPTPLPIPLPTPIPVPTPPVTYKTGGLDIPSSFQFDLDNGSVGAGGADLWYHAITATNRRLEVRNGAQIARGDGSNRGFAGCSTEAFSSAPVPFAQLAVGTYVCVKTNQGRISQFRVNGVTPTSLKIGFTTWAN